MEKNACVYILSNKPFGTLYVGVTSDLVKRIYEHKSKNINGFSKRYGLDRLVYYEQHETMCEAITREKAIKNWNRNWKCRVIMDMNPNWNDLYEEIT